MSWPAHDDLIVWTALGSLPRTPAGNLSLANGVGALVAQLAARFSRTDTAITSRLKHLDDPTHAAYARLRGVKQQPRALPAASASGGAGVGMASPRVWGATPAAHGGAAAFSPASQHGGAGAAAAPLAAGGGRGDDSGDTAALNAGQRAALARALSGASLFLTGAAGTGKSFALRRIITALEARAPGTTAVTAPTGVAAVNVGGTTIHSFAGVGLGRAPADELVAKALASHSTCERWRAAQVLVVDEVSMLDGGLLDKLDAVARAARGVPDRAFGGLQLLFCGDFFQLPPVFLGGGFAFESAAWAAAHVATCELTEIVRQSGDAPFTALLNEVRRGVLSDASAAALAACHVSRKARPADGIAPTRLYCRNADVDAENAAELAQLPGAAAAYVGVDDIKREPTSSSAERALLEGLDKKSPARLELKVGAQVMLSRNWPEHKLVNGSRGVVTSLYSDAARVRFDSGVEVVVRPAVAVHASRDGAVTRLQLPLKLAWACTVHKGAWQLRRERAREGTGG